MHTIDTILPAVDAYAKAHNADPANVVRRATGNPRLYDRLKKRVAKLEEDIERIARFMADNSSVDALPDILPPVADNDAGNPAIVSPAENHTGGEA